MKMSRDQLKALVKECLVELLSEGLGTSSLQQERRQVPRSSGRSIAGMTESRSRRSQFDPRLDTPVSSGRIPSDALKDAIKRESGGNPIMESIFADTAKTTLVQQLAAGDSSGGAQGSTGGLSQKEQFKGDPEQVFGEDVASRWANLAFMDKPTNKSA